MSSEESGDDGSFKIHPLLWRSQKADKLFFGLDHKTLKKKSKKSRLMTQDRSEGLPSHRPAPIDGSIPPWAIIK